MHKHSISSIIHNRSVAYAPALSRVKESKKPSRWARPRARRVGRAQHRGARRLGLAISRPKIAEAQSNIARGRLVRQARLARLGFFPFAIPLWSKPLRELATPKFASLPPPGILPSRPPVWTLTMQFLRRGIGAPQWRAVGGGAGFPARNAASFGSASTTGSQTTAPTLARDVTCPTPWLCKCHKPWASALPSFFSRCITTAGDSVKAPLQDSSVHLTDMPPRIKFKRLDKTARNIMKILDKEAVEEVKARRDIPDIRPGYLVRMKVEVPENKRRLSTLEGIVIARRNAGLNSTFRIRRLVAGVGIESLFPLYSPNIKEIKVLDKRKVRRAKLYYLRERLNPLKKK
ncbi:hypothetical protein NL676_028716 [Syzygium grande]|nr:hypothetical protein NL676_028716 [Syzygium grande]